MDHDIHKNQELTPLMIIATNISTIMDRATATADLVIIVLIRLILIIASISAPWGVF